MISQDVTPLRRRAAPGRKAARKKSGPKQ